MDFKNYKQVYNFNVNTKRNILPLMIKLFFITFFIAELIIAITVILKILQFDKYVISLNEQFSMSKNKIGFAFSDFRLFLDVFTSDLEKFKEALTKKRQEYFFKALKTGLIYYGAFISKGKVKKALITYQIGKEIYEGLSEARI